MSYVKRLAGMPAGYPAWEAAGLRWLADAGAARVVGVQEVGEDRLVLDLLTESRSGVQAAEEFGEALAGTHAAGAAAWGAPPPDWGQDGWIGPNGSVLPLPCRTEDTWGRFWAEHRVRPLVDLGRVRGVLDADAVALFEQLCERAEAGHFDTGDTPARLHGDLWAGNLMWTADGVVLIDPAAHGGHRETDLAMLALFGTPHLDRILAAYDEAAPLAHGWRDRVDLHQVPPLLVHTLLFGGGYRAQAVSAAQKYVR